MAAAILPESRETAEPYPKFLPHLGYRYMLDAGTRITSLTVFQNLFAAGFACFLHPVLVPGGGHTGGGGEGGGIGVLAGSGGTKAPRLSSLGPSERAEAEMFSRGKTGLEF